MYGKFFASTFTGSMLGAGADVFAVWGYVIANKSASGDLELNPHLLGAVLGMAPAAVEAVIEYLTSPDPMSRNPQDDGRRLVREGRYLYRVVSHEIYRRVRNDDDRREYNRLKKQQSRSKHVKPDVNDSASVKSNVIDGQQMSAVSAHIDVDIDVEKPSRAKSARAAKSDPTKTDLAKARHAEFKAILAEYWEYKNPETEMPWGAAEGKNLELWLRSTPSTSADQFRIFLRNRCKSEDVTHSERPSKWIGSVTSYAAGPLDRFGKPLTAGVKKSSLEGMTFANEVQQ